MKQIKTIRLQNFQSHKDTTIELDPNVNVLSGESNMGKTAILRGLLWLITNRPNGIGFVSKWAKEVNKKGEVVLTKTAMCSVSVTVVATDGKEHTLTRLRTRDKNVYEVDGVELEAVGTSVPSEISTILGMHECNIQSQDDTYFMLTLPPGQVASKLNELVHLETIDKAFEYNKKGKLRCSALVKEWDGIASESKLKLRGLSNVPEMAEELKEIQTLMEEFNDLQESLADMKLLMEDYYNRKRDLEQAVPYLDEELEMLMDRISDYEEKNASIHAAEDLLAEFDDIQSKLKECPQIEEKDMSALDKNITLYEETLEELVAMSQQSAMYSCIENDLGRIEEQLQEALKNMPKVCPTCGHKIDKGEL